MTSLVQPALLPGILAGAPQPRLVGATVALRPWREEDSAGLVGAYSDPQIQRWHCRRLDDAQARELVEQWSRDWAAETGASWAVTAIGDGLLLGRAGLRLIDLAEGVAEVAYWVLPQARRRGVATAAVSALAAWAFGVIGFQRLALLHSVQNVGSCRVATATGFVAEGTMRGSVRHVDGWHDMHLHGRLRTDAGHPPTTRS